MMIYLFKNHFMSGLEQLYFLKEKLESFKLKKTNPEELLFIDLILEENDYFQEEYVNLYEDTQRYTDKKQTYGKYAGSYAQDEEGLSDDFIDDVLGGEPGA